MASEPTMFITGCVLIPASPGTSAEHPRFDHLFALPVVVLPAQAPTGAARRKSERAILGRTATLLRTDHPENPRTEGARSSENRFQLGQEWSTGYDDEALCAPGGQYLRRSALWVQQGRDLDIRVND